MKDRAFFFALRGGLEGFRVSRNPSAQVPGAGRHARRTANDPSRAALHVVSEQTFSPALICGRNAIFGYNEYSYIRSKQETIDGCKYL